MTKDTTMTEAKKMILLKSSEGQIFELAEASAIQCETIKNMIEGGCIPGEKGIPLPNVSSKTLLKVIEYLNHHVHDDKEKGKDGEEEEKKVQFELTKWDEQFLMIDMQILFDIILAANYLNIKDLLDKTSFTIADRMKDWTVEEVRKTFGIENDFSPEEEAQVRRENQWAFE
ncbi:hypothetical protein AMTRI_Chr07g25830 [Amborella trichopoda]|uniref:SKP1-like protein 11 n=1 Tax=Amborella trichopoda TaxID=13333 RepID=UPI0005D33D2B|nr:SKP1-like protein 11 [Amborella trichopoda]|eukprot:XP_011627046.1 SKP1-like protein 11 [Amborella trichopoda]